MSSMTTLLSVQVDKEDKEQATRILQKLGVSMSGYINMSIKQLIMRGGIPFDIKLSQEEMQNILNDSIISANNVNYDDMSDLL